MVSQALDEPVGSLAVALAHTRRLLGARPDLAEAQAREILRSVPGHPEAELLLAVGLRLQGNLAGARAILVPLAASQPRAAEVQYEAGVTLAALAEGKAAISALRQATTLNPALPHAWRALGDQLTMAGQTKAADDAYARQIQASVNDPVLMEAAQALVDGRLAVTERLLRAHLNDNPTDVAAIRMLAEVGGRLGRYEDAEALLARCLELAPSFSPARYNYAIVLNRLNKQTEALAEIEPLLQQEPRNPGYRNLRAAILSQIGEYAGAIDDYASVLKDFPDQPKIWMSYGHLMKTVGRQAESIAAYRKSIDLAPALGEAYWSLANLKTVSFEASDMEAMRAQLARQDITNEDRFHLHFALGKALEDAGLYADSFEHYRQGNALRREAAPYDADLTHENVQRTIATFTSDFVASRAGSGCPAPDPIFVVGLPRSGSTLVEQILSSHSVVEGTMELPDIIAIAKRLGGRRAVGDSSAYPECLGELGADDLAELGEEFLARTRVQRKLGRPFFIDKMPNNFMHVGMIHLVLPNAKIIDARRRPMACCFSGFKQHFARGQLFTYDLDDIGRYYADYVALMSHFDAVLPGRVHRVIYEQMVADPEAEVRRLLAYCGLPFEEQCLRFYESGRAVRTASSEQVRRPIFTDGVDQWRNFEPFLGALEAALGPILTTYPDAPFG